MCPTDRPVCLPERPHRVAIIPCKRYKLYLQPKSR